MRSRVRRTQRSAHPPPTPCRAEAASTLAGNLTPLGSVANLIVIEQARRTGVDVSFGTYLRVGVPLTVLTLAVAVMALGLNP